MQRGMPLYQLMMLEFQSCFSPMLAESPGCSKSPKFRGDNLAGCGFNEKIQRSQKRRLPRTRKAYQHGKLTG
jgi:hypothetical protein